MVHDEIVELGMCEVPTSDFALEQKQLTLVTEVGQCAPVLGRHELNITSAHCLEKVLHEST
jgi:hypothetical protein